MPFPSSLIDVSNVRLDPETMARLTITEWCSNVDWTRVREDGFADKIIDTLERVLVRKFAAMERAAIDAAEWLSLETFPTNGAQVAALATLEHKPLSAFVAVAWFDKSIKAVCVSHNHGAFATRIHAWFPTPGIRS